MPPRERLDARRTRRSGQESEVTRCDARWRGSSDASRVYVTAVERQRGEIDGYDEWVRGYGKTSGARYNRAIYAVVPVDGSSRACIVEYANDDSPVRHLKTDRCWQPRRLRGVKRAFVTASVTRFTRDHRSVNIVVGRTNDYPERRNERKKKQ